MSFNPLKNIFGDKVEAPSVPKRGPGGRFVSAKKKEEKETKSIHHVESSHAQSFPPLTFYGHQIRRFYKDGKWYMSIEDISKTAYLNADDPNVRKGDPEKLAEAVKKFSIVIENIKVADPIDIATFIPFFKGNMPGPICDWLKSNATLPVPQPEKTKTEESKEKQPPINPSETGM